MTSYDTELTPMQETLFEIAEVGDGVAYKVTCGECGREGGGVLFGPEAEPSLLCPECRARGGEAA